MNIVLFRKNFSFVIISSILLLILANSTSTAQTTHDFSILTLDGDILNISELGNKPIVLDWAASWCTICQQNQVSFNNLYPNYNAYVTFLTVSYGGSGDDINDVRGLRDAGDYPWVFGLDIDNYARSVGTSNGYVWILNSDLTLAQEWEYQVVPRGELRAGIDAVIEPIITTITSETTVTSESIVTESGSTFVETSVVTQTSEITSTITPQSVSDSFNTFDLENNPFFLGFITLTSISTLVIISVKVARNVF